LPTSVSAITNYQAGDKLYVLAVNGLVLRDKPDPVIRKMTANVPQNVILSAAKDLAKQNQIKVP
jgi:hypothetical protein